MALTTGQIAKEAGVDKETVRYYERRGLIGPFRRSAGGYRQYPHDTVRRIRFIKRAQEVGFSLKEIRSLLEIRVSVASTCADVRKEASAKVDDIRSKIRRLSAMEEILVELMRRCETSEPTSECPILNALETENGF